MDFNVADSVRRNIKVLVTKTRYMVVYICYICIYVFYIYFFVDGVWYIATGFYNNLLI